MKANPIAMSFLDLLFSAFAAIVGLNVVLAVTEGKTEHAVERDFIAVVVEWEPEDGLEKALRERPALRLRNSRGQTVDWTYRASPTMPSGDDRAKRARSVFFLAPVDSETFRLDSKSARFIRRILIRTRRGETERAIEGRPFLEFIMTASR